MEAWDRTTNEKLWQEKQNTFTLEVSIFLYEFNTVQKNLSAIIATLSKSLGQNKTP